MSSVEQMQELAVRVVQARRPPVRSMSDGVITSPHHVTSDDRDFGDEEIIREEGDEDMISSPTATTEDAAMVEKTRGAGSPWPPVNQARLMAGDATVSPGQRRGHARSHAGGAWGAGGMPTQPYYAPLPNSRGAGGHPPPLPPGTYAPSPFGAPGFPPPGPVPYAPNPILLPPRASGHTRHGPHAKKPKQGICRI